MSRIYAALGSTVLVADGDPGEWHVTDRTPDPSVRCLAAAPERPERVLCGTGEAGLHRSTTAGETWTRVGEDALPDRVTALAVSPVDPDEVWAGTEPSRVFRSTDGGETWTEREGLTDLPSASEWSFPPRPHTHHVRWLEVDPTDARLYVAVEAGALVRSTDGGETWLDRVPSGRRDTHSMATHPDAPGRAWVAAGDGYAETADGGDTWTHPQEGLEHRYCWSVAVDPDAETVLLSSARSARTAHTPGRAETYVYRRVGEGRWERSMDGLPEASGLLRPVLAAGAPGEFYALTNRGLFRSVDGGETWMGQVWPWKPGYERQAPRALRLV
ncbi:WD40/YVTN/BNR-like repeat-containing protein [Halomarina ordinaria]|uniref:WD40/YVTN/BNR-like repeat-containing protein n=1 Tax=Halomarina ordinaria TaxID=3033939 RepID=A0ABD5U8V1_9EURY|nr:hypothetical protein [Halomarina sp. PSRA2]